MQQILLPWWSQREVFQESGRNRTKSSRIDEAISVANLQDENRSRSAVSSERWTLGSAESGDVGRLHQQNSKGRNIHQQTALVEVHIFVF